MKSRLQALRSLRWNYKRRGVWVWLKGRKRCATCLGGVWRYGHRGCPNCHGKPKSGYQRILSEPKQVLAEQERAAAGAAT